MMIKNIKRYTEEEKFVDGKIYIMEDKFSEENDIDSEVEVIDGEGCYAIPGLIDLHFHGCMGYDICDGTKEAIEKIAEYEASVGVTAICPATMTLPVDELNDVLSTAAEFKKEQEAEKREKEADLIGLNMEGPFISPAKKGAQDARNILPCDEKIARGFLKASDGLVKFIGVAPEESEFSTSFIEEMKKEVIISLAHTNANFDSADEAFKAGAKHAIHLYNAMTGFTHRDPGVVGAVCENKHVTAELICDGIHIHPSAVRTTFSMLGSDRIILISDSMRATGMTDGIYTLGGLDVKVEGNKATLVSDGAIAGSVTNLMECMKTAVQKMEIPLEVAVACATKNPAKCLGVYDKYGSITAGKKANLVLLDKELNVKAVMKDGKRIR
ncbi:MAG: N-acetylglucosamine-6-phosphate deacetylase [Lachnospiraceae bacterium]